MSDSADRPHPSILVRVLCCFLFGLSGCVPLFAQGSPFLPGVNYPVPGQGGVAIADFNGDNRPDIVIANGDSTVSILLGNGDGTFQNQFTVVAVPSSSTFDTEAVAVGDFNRDGYPDLAVLCVSSLSAQITSPGTTLATVNILLNNADGTGTFGAPSIITLSSRLRIRE
jgi:FG-GAP-like repeat